VSTCVAACTPTFAAELPLACLALPTSRGGWGHHAKRKHNAHRVTDRARERHPCTHQVITTKKKVHDVVGLSTTDLGMRGPPVLAAMRPLISRTKSASAWVANPVPAPAPAAAPPSDDFRSDLCCFFDFFFFLLFLLFLLLLLCFLLFFLCFFFLDLSRLCRFFLLLLDRFLRARRRWCPLESEPLLLMSESELEPSLSLLLLLLLLPASLPLLLLLRPRDLRLRGLLDRDEERRLLPRFTGLRLRLRLSRRLRLPPLRRRGELLIGPTKCVRCLLALQHRKPNKFTTEQHRLF